MCYWLSKYLLNFSLCLGSTVPHRIFVCSSGFPFLLAFYLLSLLPFPTHPPCPPALDPSSKCCIFTGAGRAVFFPGSLVVLFLVPLVHISVVARCVTIQINTGGGLWQQGPECRAPAPPSAVCAAWPRALRWCQLLLRSIIRPCLHRALCL